jgi:hypothetical protein
MYVAPLPHLQKKIFILFLLIFLHTSLIQVFCQQDSVKQDQTDSAKIKGGNLFPADSSGTSRELLAKDDLIIGERLFHGLVYSDKSLKCSACHSVYADSFSDTINWNPNALEISLKYRDRTAYDLGKVLLNPLGKKMAQVHHAFKFTPDEIRQLKAFMDEFTGTGLKQKKPVITNLLLFIVASVLFLASFTDLLVTKKLKKQWINMAVASVTIVYITWVLVLNAIAIGRSKGYSPDQPIKFSHAVHAGQNQTDCLYCHNYATYSKVSGIPSGNVCMNCHLLVRNGTRSGMFEIAKVTDAYDNHRAIEWIQVHNLPDHVYFNHSQHVNAGGLKCQECHGPVQEMDRIVQYSDLSMGFCVNCHRSRKVNFNENAFYTQYKSLSEKMRTGQLDSVTVDQQGGSECMRCHY